MLHPLEWEMAGERAAAAQGALDFELGAVALQNVFHNGEAEAGTTEPPLVRPPGASGLLSPPRPRRDQGVGRCSAAGR